MTDSSGQGGETPLFIWDSNPGLLNFIEVKK